MNIKDCGPILFRVFLTLISPLFVSPVSAAQYTCASTPSVVITAPNDQMRDPICTASERAIRFLGHYQLTPKRAISIEVVEEVINQDGYMAIGSYDRQSDKIVMMSLPAVLQSGDSPSMYAMPFDQEHYYGAVAHEITHAVFQHNATTLEDKWNNAAQEYLAHAAQLGVLSAARREAIINAAATGPWESGDEISVTYMGFNPTGFAVKSYLHLTQQADPQAFIELLLNHKWLYISVP